MKKNKLVAMTALGLVLGLTGCEPKECEKHTWGEYVVTKEATCTEEGTRERTCTVCGKKDEVNKIKVKNHTYVEETEKRVEPSCTAEGKKFSKCSVCGAEKEDKLNKVDHTYAKDADGNDVVAWEKAPTCTEAGVNGKKTCTVCGADAAVTQGALNHIYAKDADGNDIVTWTQEATCEKKGKGTKECTRCGAKSTVSKDALGHDIKLEGEEVTPEAGKAAVRIYKCQREGCDVQYLGFKASEVTAASKERLVMNEYELADGTKEIGARFFGHPIGNDVPLNEETGDAEESYHPSIYNKEQTGDFFEYVFDLTAQQAAQLGDVRLYCDAKPAQYLGANGIDFWANKSGDTDWTRGMYIDDDPAHAATFHEGDNPNTNEEEDGYYTGVEITDYRYVLYVDGELKSFDPDLKSPVPNGDPRGEYVLPYTFNLHEGTNKISLRMAGGYRSEFFNFTFRSVDVTKDDEQTDPLVLETASVVEKEGKPYLKIQANSIVDADEINSYLTWVNFQDVGSWANIGQGNETEPTMIAREWDLSELETKGKAYMLIDISALEVGSNYNTHFNYHEAATADCKLTAAIDKVYKAAGKSYEIVSIPGSTLSGNDGFWGNLGIRVLDTSDFKAEPTVDAKNADGKTVRQYSSELGLKQRIAIAVADYSSTSANAIKENNNGIKLNKNGSLTYKINCNLPDTTDMSGNSTPTTQKAKLVIGDTPGSSDHVKCHLFNDYFIPDVVKEANPDIQGSKLGTPDKETEDAWRIHVYVNGVEVPVTNYQTLAEMGLESGKLGYIEVCDVTLKNGENTIEIKQGNIGYSFVFGGEVRLEWSGTNTVAMDAPAETPAE